MSPIRFGLALLMPILACGAVAAQPRSDRFGDPLPPSVMARLGTVRFRDCYYVQSLAVTPDGRFLVSGADDGATVWDAATGKAIRRLRATAPGMIRTALSADGKLVAVGGWGPARDRAGAVYELATGRKRYGFGNRGYQTSYGQFSPDSAILAVYGLDNDIQLHDARTGKRNRLLKGHQVGMGDGFNTVGEVVFSPDSKTLYSPGMDGTIRVWDVAAGKEMHRMTAGGSVQYLNLSADGRWLASQGWVKVESKVPGQFVQHVDDHVRLWDTTLRKEARQIRVPSAPRADGARIGPNFVTFTPDGKDLVTGGTDGMVRVWDPQTGNERRKVPGVPCHIGDIAFMPGGKAFACIEGHALRIREFATGRDLVHFDAPRYEVTAVALSRDGRAVATVEENRLIHLWDGPTGKHRRQFVPLDSRVRFLRFDPDGARCSPRAMIARCAPGHGNRP